MSARAGGGGAGDSGGRAVERGAGPAGREGGADGRPEAATPIPIVSMILMAIFVVGGSIGLLADWPAGPGNLDWGVWVVLYGGYGYVIGAAIFHARTGR